MNEISIEGTNTIWEMQNQHFILPKIIMNPLKSYDYTSYRKWNNLHFNQKIFQHCKHKSPIHEQLRVVFKSWEFSIKSIKPGKISN